MYTLNQSLLNKNVNRNKKYEAIVELFVRPNTNSDSNLVKVFPNIKDLIIFAAMLGKHYERREEVDKSDCQGVTLLQFSGSGSTKDSRQHQHHLIFMFGVLCNRDMNFARDENVDYCISLFEEYSNGGLAIIKEWLEESAWKQSIIFEKLSNLILEDKKVGVELPTDVFG